jgi:ribosome-binding protein aMBF1 (putative translation factor)
VASKRRFLKISNYQRAYAAFRKRLREAREQADMTQTETASALKTYQSFVSKCESGERRVDYVELKEFARLYKVPLSFFD